MAGKSLERQLRVAPHGSFQEISRSLTEEKFPSCQPLHPTPEIPESTHVAFQATQNTGKTSRWMFIFPVSCPMDESTLFKPFLTHLSSKPPSVEIPPFPSSQQLIPALLYPTALNLLCWFLSSLFLVLSTGKRVPPLPAEAFYIIAGCYPISHL